jgi:hypothetical protein
VLSTVSPGVAGEAATGSRPEPGRVAYDQVDVLVQAHRYAEAETLARKLLKQAERADGPRSLRTADALALCANMLETLTSSSLV